MAGPVVVGSGELGFQCLGQDTRYLPLPCSSLQDKIFFLLRGHQFSRLAGYYDPLWPGRNAGQLGNDPIQLRSWGLKRAVHPKM